MGAPINGGFELFDYNDIIDINTPTGWHCENYTAVVGNFIPHPEQGNTTNWKINLTEGLHPFEGNSFLVLSTGDWPQGSTYAKVWQNITVGAGDKLTGAYFFGTCDYWDFNDFAYIKLIPVPGGDPNYSDVNIVQVSLMSVGGDYSSLSGWKRFEYTFDADQAGTYELTLFVSDYRDNILDSYLAVDGLALCHNPPAKGDLNCDCIVNFVDFTILANDWWYNCNDQNVFNDPNRKCLLGTDLTGDGPVDTNDLRVMSEYWLQGSAQP
jgi:hypothetical protein